MQHPADAWLHKAAVLYTGAMEHATALLGTSSTTTCVTAKGQRHDGNS